MPDFNQQAILNNHAVQQALMQWRAQGLDASSGRGHGVSLTEVAAQRAAHAAGMPEGYYLTSDGRISQQSMKPWLTAAAVLGGATAPFLAGPAAATAGGSHAAASTFAGASPDFFAPPAALSTGAAAGGGAASALGGGALGTALKIGIPAGLTALTMPHGNGMPDGQSPNGLTPELEQQLMDLLDMQKRRLGRQEPVHEAAMRLATNLSNRPSANPRINSTSDPQVLDAIQRLTAGAR